MVKDNTLLSRDIFLSKTNSFVKSVKCRILWSRTTPFCQGCQGPDPFVKVKGQKPFVKGQDLLSRVILVERARPFARTLCPSMCKEASFFHRLKDSLGVHHFHLDADRWGDLNVCAKSRHYIPVGIGTACHGNKLWMAGSIQNSHVCQLLDEGCTQVSMRPK